MVEPPAVGRGDDEVASPALAQLLQVCDRLGAVGRVVARPAAVLALREVARPVPVQLQQALVAAADNQHLPTLRDRLVDRLAQALGLALVARIRAAAVGLPLAPPLLRVALLVGAEDALVLAAGD